MEKKQEGSQSRGWMLTLKAEAWTKEEVEEKLAPWPFIGQLERGKERTEANPEGYLHWQIYLEAKSPIRFNTLQKLFPTGSNIAPRRGTKQQAFDYVTKADTAQGVTISGGVIDLKSRQGSREDLNRLRDLVLVEGHSYDQIILAEPSAARFDRYLRALCESHSREQAKNQLRDVDAHYLWGKTGVGKTRGLWETYGSSMFRVTNYAHPFDGYRGEDVLVLDEFHGELPLNLMLNLLDRYPLELPCRYANRWAAFTKVFVVSNSPLHHHYRLIQQEKPEVWAALLRRFASIEEMKASQAA